VDYKGKEKETEEGEEGGRRGSDTQNKNSQQ